MKVQELAEFIISKTYDGCPGDEPYQVAVEQEVKRLRSTYIDGDPYEWGVVVAVED
jgi:hypothetical protein